MVHVNSSGTVLFQLLGCVHTKSVGCGLFVFGHVVWLTQTNGSTAL